MYSYPYEKGAKRATVMYVRGCGSKSASGLPGADLLKDENPLVEALFNHQLLHVEVYIVHVDMVLWNEVAFKLTPDSIEALIDYHKEIHCADVATNTYNLLEKELQVKKLHDEFI